MKSRRAGWVGVLVGVLALGAFGLAANQSGLPAAAQVATSVPRPRLTIPPLPPTFPCPLCGPSGLVDSGVVAWAYPLHFCLVQNAPDATFAIIYGWGRNNTGPATFFGSIQGRVRQLRTLQPGDETAEFFLPPNPLALTVAPGEQFLLTVWATTNGTSTGPRVVFGNGTTQRQMVLICTCPASQTVVTTTPASPTTTVASPTSVGSTPTTPGSPTTVKPLLPPTGLGDTMPWVAAGGLVALYLGLLAWSHTRRLED